MNMEEAKKLLEERKEIVTDVIRQRKRPKRIPLLSQVRAWNVLDAGFGLIEGLSSYDNLFKAACHMQETYDFDVHIYPGTRFPYKVYEALGSSPYLFDDENSKIEYLDREYMSRDDYPVLFEKGVVRFLFENVFPKRFDSFQNMTPDEAVDHIAKAFEENLAFNKLVGDINKYFAEEYGVPTFTSGVNFMPNLDNMFMGLRGMKGIACDIRKNPDQLEKACNEIDFGHTRRQVETLSTYKPKEYEINSMYMPLVANTMLNPKQFERFVWPTLKAHFDAIEKSDGTGCIFTEGKMEHLVDYFRDIPANRFVLVTEQDDIRVLRDKLPNLSFAGGIDTYLLGHGTKQQCIDMAKKMVDEIGYDGRLIACTDKMLAYKGDAKQENLKAVNDFIREYSSSK